MSRTRVAIVRGGLSEEYDVSLKTGSAVLEAIDRERFNPIDIVITKSGEWLLEGRSRFPEHIIPTFDVVFIALHGAYGEDGTIQRLIDRFGVPYTGSKAYASSIAIHKGFTKDMLKDSGIKMAPHLIVRKDACEDVHKLSESIVDCFGPEYVIKPVSSGSSLGTMMVKNPALLPQALTDALERFDEVIVEKRILGREATCGVVENFRNQDLYVLPPIEIIPPVKAEFFSHDVKYTGETEEICPARFDRATKDTLEHHASLVHSILDLSQYSRSDFMIADDGVYFLEVNTLPGLTKNSLLPKAIDAVGGTYEDFITHLIIDAQKSVYA